MKDVIFKTLFMWSGGDLGSPCLFVCLFVCFLDFVDGMGTYQLDSGFVLCSGALLAYIMCTWDTPPFYKALLIYRLHLTIKKEVLKKKTKKKTKL